MSEREQIGGVAWEARTSLNGVRLAREAGDDEAEYAAWIRYAEALTNASYSGAAQAFKGRDASHFEISQGSARRANRLAEGVSKGW